MMAGMIIVPIRYDTVKVLESFSIYLQAVIIRSSTLLTFHQQFPANTYAP